MATMTADEAMEVLKITPDQGRWLGSDGCSHESIADLLKTDTLNLCGCGYIHAIVKRMAEVIRLIHQQRDIDWTSMHDIVAFHQTPEYKAREAKILELCGGDDVIQEFVLHVLDREELLEHGTSISGCWPTEKGYAFMALADTIED
jgi:hypothetical protein